MLVQIDDNLHEPRDVANAKNADRWALGAPNGGLPCIDRKMGKPGQLSVKMPVFVDFCRPEEMRRTKGGRHRGGSFILRVVTRWRLVICELQCLKCCLENNEPRYPIARPWAGNEKRFTPHSDPSMGTADGFRRLDQRGRE